MDAFVRSVGTMLCDICASDNDLARVCTQSVVDSSSWLKLIETAFVVTREPHALQGIRAAQTRMVEAFEHLTLRDWASAMWLARRMLRTGAFPQEWDAEWVHYKETLAELRVDAQLSVLLSIG